MPMTVHLRKKLGATLPPASSDEAPTTPATITDKAEQTLPSERSIKHRWGNELEVISRWRKNYTGLGGFVPIVRSFLRLYSQLGMTAMQAMLIVHILESKWDSRAPSVKAQILADRMGIGKQQLLRHIRQLKARHNIDYTYAKKTDLYTFTFDAFFAKLAELAEARRAQTAEKRRLILDQLNEGTWA